MRTAARRGNHHPPIAIMQNLASLGFNPAAASSMALPPGTSSNDVLAWLQQTYGAVRYTAQQMIRWPYYSYAVYPAAGASQLSFFSSNFSGATYGLQQTNIENPGAFGNYSFLITSVSLDWFAYIPTVANNQPNSYTTDALALYADIVHGFTQAGVFEFRIANTLWIQAALPFMTLPSAIGRPRVQIAQGGFPWTQAGLTPFAITGGQASLCYADTERRAWKRPNLVNPIFVAPQQTFTATLGYPSGLIPVISTSIINNSTSFLFVGTRIDGWKFTPVS